MFIVRRFIAYDFVNMHILIKPTLFSHMKLKKTQDFAMFIKNCTVYLDGIRNIPTALQRRFVKHKTTS